MVKPLCSFTVCQVVTLRDIVFSWSKIQKQLNLKSKSGSKYENKRFLKQKSFEAQKSSEEPRIVKKIRKVSYFVNDPKTSSLERIRVAHNNFSCYDTNSRGTVRRILKKYGVFSRNAAKNVSLKKKSKCFRSNWRINMLKKQFSFW